MKLTPNPPVEKKYYPLYVQKSSRFLFVANFAISFFSFICSLMVDGTLYYVITSVDGVIVEYSIAIMLFSSFAWENKLYKTNINLH